MTGLSHPLPAELVDLISNRFRLLGEPMRIRLLEELRDGPATVSDLCASLDATQQNVSKHLCVLHQHGILRREKRGNFVHYEIADPSVFELCDLVCGGLRRQLEALDSLLAEGGRA